MERRTDLSAELDSGVLANLKFFYPKSSTTWGDVMLRFAVVLSAFNNVFAAVRVNAIAVEVVARGILHHLSMSLSKWQKPSDTYEGPQTLTTYRGMYGTRLVPAFATASSRRICRRPRS